MPSPPVPTQKMPMLFKVSVIFSVTSQARLGIVPSIYAPTATAWDALLVSDKITRAWTKVGHLLCPGQRYYLQTLLILNRLNLLGDKALKKLNGKISFFKLKILKRIKQKGSKLLLGKYNLLCSHSEPILQTLKRRKEASLSDFSSQEKAESIWQQGKVLPAPQKPRQGIHISQPWCTERSCLMYKGQN